MLLCNNVYRKKNKWLWTTASEQFKIACNVIPFLTKRFLSPFFYVRLNVRLDINIEFLKIAKSEPIASIEQV